MELCTLASGSSGNCLLARTAQGTVLVDAGISCKRICDGLKVNGVRPEDIDGILITHEHSDHIAGLRVLLKKYRIPVYTSAPTGEQLVKKVGPIEDLIRPVASEKPFTLGGLDILPFATPHDAAGSLGFTFADGKRRAAVATDLGHVTETVRNAVRGSDFVLVETNYEPDWLWDGPYAYPLKQRINGDYGHLSNGDGGAFACELAATGTRTVVLGHLSKENNTPEKAWEVVTASMRQAGIRPNEDVVLQIAPRSEVSQVWQV